MADTVDMLHFDGMTKDEVYDELDALEVGTRITGLVDNSGYEAKVEKAESFSPNYFAPQWAGGSPNDYGYMKTEWRVNGYEKWNLGSVIYEVLNGGNEHYFVATRKKGKRVMSKTKTAGATYELVVDGEFCDGYCYVDVDDNGDVESYEVDVDCWGENGEENINFWQQAYAQLQPADLALEIISDCEAEYGDELGIDWHHLTQQLEAYIPKHGRNVRKRAWMTWSDDPEWWDEYGKDFEMEFDAIVDHAEKLLRDDMANGTFDNPYVEEANGRTYLTVDAVEWYSEKALAWFGYPYNDEAESRVSLELDGDVSKYPEYSGRRATRRRAQESGPEDWFGLPDGWNEALGCAVVQNFGPAWSSYDIAAAERMLRNYGEIYIDEFGLPIANERTQEDIYLECQSWTARRKTASGWEPFTSNVTSFGGLSEREYLDMFGAYTDESWTKVESGFMGVVSHHVGQVDDWWTWDTYMGYLSYGIDCGHCDSLEEGKAMCERSFADPGFTVNGKRASSSPGWHLEEYSDDGTLRMLYEGSAFTWEGMDASPGNLDAICEHFAQEGFWAYGDTPVVFYLLKGRDMNRLEGLTGSNAYPDDLNILSIPNDQLNISKMIPIQITLGARWMDDIVENNRVRENAAW